MTDLDELHRDVKALRTEIRKLSHHLADPDSIMTPAEAKRFTAAMREYRRGNTTSLEDLKAELA